jgi:uncharacterized protein YegP (UPF0339 family)
VEPEELALGKFLHGEAQEGRLKGVESVEGAPESRVRGDRSGDYRFHMKDGTIQSADGYAPKTGDLNNISSACISKGNQAETVVVEFRRGAAAAYGKAEAKYIADYVLGTPGHGVKRLIFVKDGQVMLDRP